MSIQKSPKWHQIARSGHRAHLELDISKPVQQKDGREREAEEAAAMSWATSLSASRAGQSSPERRELEMVKKYIRVCEGG